MNKVKRQVTDHSRLDSSSSIIKYIGFVLMVIGVAYSIFVFIEGLPILVFIILIAAFVQGLILLGIAKVICLLYKMNHSPKLGLKRYRI